MNTSKSALYISLFVIVVVIIGGGAMLYRTASSSENGAATTPGKNVACTMEAKICPDGSAVGREGPNCEFAACPVASATSTSGYHTGDTVTVTTHIGQAVTALGEKITPTAVIDDSRCPTDVQCIWAGTVHVKATVVSGMGTGEITFELGKTATTEVNSITLESVSPAKNSEQDIASGDYVLTFKVRRR